MRLWRFGRPKAKAGDKPIGVRFVDAEGDLALDLQQRVTYVGWDQPGDGENHTWAITVTPEEAQRAYEQRWSFRFEEIPPKTTVHIVTEACE